MGTVIHYFLKSSKFSPALSRARTAPASTTAHAHAPYYYFGALLSTSARGLTHHNRCFTSRISSRPVHPPHPRLCHTHPHGRVLLEVVPQQKPHLIGSNIHDRIHNHNHRQQQQCHRSSSTMSGGKGPQPRKRFYRHVGVTQVAPPWELRLASDNNSNKNTVENPISAGVDGTQSASGVIGHLGHSKNGDTQHSPREKQIELLQQRLIPRCTTISLNHHQEHPTTSNYNSQQPWYSVTLDGRTLRTPLGQVLSLPSPMLAWAIAAEWDAQATLIKPVQMPLMTLACTTLDQTAQHPELYQTTALQFLPTDTTCYWADPTEDRVLHRHQQAAWNDLHHFIQQELQEKPAMAMGAQEGVLLSRRNHEGTKLRGLPHPPSLYHACVEWTRQLDAWHLTALNAVAAETKSFLVAYAVLHPKSPFSTHNDENAFSKAIRAARVEEEFQIESWGLVEGQHDYDRLNCSVQVRSAKFLAKCVLEK